MARPSKNEDEKMSGWIRARVKPSQEAQVQRNAEKAGMGNNIAEFIRLRALEERLPSSRSVSADPALIAALNNYALAISQIGNNVNQLAAATHMGRDFTRYWQEIGAELERELNASRAAIGRALEDNG